MLTCELVTFRQSKANIFPCFKSLCSAKLTAVCLPESVILISLNFCQQSNYHFRNIKIVYTGVANSWKANSFSTVKVNQAFLWWIVPPYLCLCTTSAPPYGGFEYNEIADKAFFAFCCCYTPQSDDCPSMRRCRICKCLQYPAQTQRSFIRLIHSEAAQVLNHRWQFKLHWIAHGAPAVHHLAIFLYSYSFLICLQEQINTSFLF